MTISKFSINRRVTVLMITLGIIVFGWFSLNRLKLRLLPVLTYPTLTVRTEIGNASPEEVENLISKPIEEELGTLNNLQNITSVSMAGISDVMVELYWKSDINRAIMDIREKLDKLRLPEDAESPRLLRYNPETEPIITIAVSGDNPIEINRIVDKEIKPLLETLDGVAAAQIVGGEEEEILIEIDSNQLSTMKMDINHLAVRLQRENVNLPGGILQEGNKQYLVRTINEFENISEIGDIVISIDEPTIRLKDIARIRKNKIDRKSITHLNGNESVLIEIYKEGDANIIDVAGRVQTLFRKPVSGKNQESVIQSYLPDTYNAQIISDQSIFIKSAINEVKRTAILGSILAVFVLFLFLRNLPHTIIIGLAIPISVISTFSLMYFKDITMNLMSLGGLALGIGMLVDNAIVVLENIFRYREEGETPEKSSEQGANDVSTAVTASTLTTIAVFFPIIFVSGIAGQIFNDLAWTVAFSLLASLVVALTLIPMISSLKLRHKTLLAAKKKLWLPDTIQRFLYLYPEKKFFLPFHLLKKSIQDSFHFILSHFKDNFHGSISRSNKSIVQILIYPITFIVFFVELIFISLSIFLQNFIYFIFKPIIFLIGTIWLIIITLSKPVLNTFDRFFRLSKFSYERILSLTLKKPFWIVGSSFLVMGIVAFILLPKLGMELIPTMSQGMFYIDVKLPVGKQLEATEKVTGQIENLIISHPEVKTVSSIIGKTSSNTSNLAVEQENLSTVTVITHQEYLNEKFESQLIEKIRNQISNIPGISSYKIRRPSLFSLKTPLQIEIRGNSINTLLETSNQLVEKLQKNPMLADVTSTLEPGYPEIQIIFDRLKLARLGMTPVQVADKLSEILEGVTPTEFNQYNDEIDIRIRAKDNKKWTVSRLNNLIISYSTQSPVTLGNVAIIHRAIGPSEIRRIDQRRVALISSDIRLWDLRKVVNDVEKILSTNPSPPGITYAITGQNLEMQESSTSLRIALLMAIFLVYLVMASQFESLVHPFTILLSIPLAIIGVIVGLYFFNIPLSVVVFIGMIVLCGIVVNNAIVLVDTINRFRSRGLSIRSAVLQASQIRFRPILMTALTTILGLTPMALESGPGVEIRLPLAITVILGLIFSTALTLVIIPSFYCLVNRDHP